MTELINQFNKYIKEKNTENRNKVLSLIFSNSLEKQRSNAELFEKIFIELSLPFNVNTGTILSDVIMSEYVLEDKALSARQIEVLEYFENTESPKVWLNAPTSFGKTLTALSIIEKKKYKKTAIIVPSIFLLNELFTKLENSWFDGDISVYGEKENATNKYIHILTPERYLSSNVDYDFVVYDEFYKVADNVEVIKDEMTDVRHFSFRKAFKKLRTSSSDMLLLSPWVQFNTKDEWYKNMQEKYGIKFYDFVSSLPLTMTIQEIQEFNGDLGEFVKKDLHGISLIFCNSYGDIKKVSNHLLEALPVINENNEISKLFKENATIKGSVYYDMIKRGVMIIGASVPRFLLMESANILKEHPEQIQYIISTSSISEGVNLPIDNIYVYSINKRVTAFDIKNLSGRAGRYKDNSSSNKGHIFMKTDLIKKMNEQQFIRLSDLTKDGDDSETKDDSELSDLERKEKENIDNKLDEYGFFEGDSLSSAFANIQKKRIFDLIMTYEEKVSAHAIEIKDLYDSISKPTSYFKKEDISNSLSSLSNIYKILLGDDNNISKGLSAPSTLSIVNMGIYKYQIYKLKTLENIKPLDDIKYNISRDVSLIIRIISHNMNLEYKHFGRFLETFASNAREALANDYCLPKNAIYKTGKMHPFEKKYVSKVKEMLKDE